jgi:hypothetical protein
VSRKCRDCGGAIELSRPNSMSCRKCDGKRKPPTASELLFRLLTADTEHTDDGLVTITVPPRLWADAQNWLRKERKRPS